MSDKRYLRDMRHRRNILFAAAAGAALVAAGAGAAIAKFAPDFWPDREMRALFDANKRFIFSKINSTAWRQGATHHVRVPVTGQLGMRILEIDWMDVAWPDDMKFPNKCRDMHIADPITRGHMIKLQCAFAGEGERKSYAGFAPNLTP